jgi:hypothetical protein
VKLSNSRCFTCNKENFKGYLEGFFYNDLENSRQEYNKFKEIYDFIKQSLNKIIHQEKNKSIN